MSDPTPEQRALWAADRAQIVASFLATWRAVRCDACGHGEDLTTETVDRYMAQGWPRHCEKEMRVVARETRP